MTVVNNSVFSYIFWHSLLIKQNRHHKYGVLFHTFKVTLAVIKSKDYKFIASALLHDIAKPFVTYIDEKKEDGYGYSFTDHEEKSYLIIKNWFFLSDWTKDIVRYHYIIRDISKCEEEGKLERLARLQKSWDSLDDKFIEELRVFIVYDEYGKS